MDNAPGRIWATTETTENGWMNLWREDTRKDQTEYVRADIQAALHAENAALRKAADELAGAADALWMEAHQNMTGGKGHLLDDVVVTLSAYRAARGDT